jgi:hypothetical protein
LNGLWQLAAILSGFTLMIAFDMRAEHPSDWTNALWVAVGLGVVAVVLFRISREHNHAVYISQGTTETVVFESSEADQARNMRSAVEKSMTS